MAHGTPDWGVTAGAVTTYQLTDLGELAARLGSIVTFDRRGDVILLEDFEDGHKRWTLAAPADGASAGLSVATARSGRYSLKLVAGTSGNPFARAVHSRAAPPAGALGLEASFTLTDNTADWEIVLEWSDGATRYIIAVRYVHPPTSKLQIWVGADWTTIAELTQQDADPKLFHTLKIVGDPSDGYYKRLLFNQWAYDLSSSQLPTGGVSSPYSLKATLRHNGDGDGAAAGYLEDVILTQNEPA